MEINTNTDYSWMPYPEFHIQEPEHVPEDPEIELENSADAENSSLNSEMGDSPNW